MRTAVIGLGRMGLRHLKIACRLGHDIVGLFDRREELVGDALSEFGLPNAAAYTDIRAMFEGSGAECVIIATTADSHCDLTVAAAESGARWILCEKPMAVSLLQCDEMIKACASTGTLLAINHQMRFMEQYTVPKSIINSEQLGGLTSITAVAGNFGLAMNGSHYFEMFRFMTDEVATTVNARFSRELVPNPRGAHFVDRAGAVRAETASGIRLYLEAGADQGHGVQVTYGGRYGRLTVDELAGSATLTARRPEYRDLPTTRYGMPSVEDTLKIAPADAFEPSRAVLNALLEGENYPTGLDGRHALEVLVAAHVSDEQESRVVQLEREILPRDRIFPWA